MIDKGCVLIGDKNYERLLFPLAPQLKSESQVLSCKFLFF